MAWLNNHFVLRGFYKSYRGQHLRDLLSNIMPPSFGLDNDSMWLLSQTRIQISTLTNWHLTLIDHFKLLKLQPLFTVVMGVSVAKHVLFEHKDIGFLLFVLYVSVCLFEGNMHENTSYCWLTPEEWGVMQSSANKCLQLMHSVPNILSLQWHYHRGVVSLLVPQIKRGAIMQIDFLDFFAMLECCALIKSVPRVVFLSACACLSNLWVPWWLFLVPRHQLMPCFSSWPFTLLSTFQTSCKAYPFMSGAVTSAEVTATCGMGSPLFFFFFLLNQALEFFKVLGQYSIF